MCLKGLSCTINMSGIFFQSAQQMARVISAVLKPRTSLALWVTLAESLHSIHVLSMFCSQILRLSVLPPASPLLQPLESHLSPPAWA